MATLTGPEILRRIADGSIVIRPFDPDCINPNSYNLHLDDRLLTYAAGENDRWRHTDLNLRRFDPALDVLDARAENATYPVMIYPAGTILMPGMLYLGQTTEWTETTGLVPRIDGRSSFGRLGGCVHLTAGYGDDGYRGTWTLEITVVHPLRIYPGMSICQISYSTIEGERRPYKGKYQDATAPEASRLWQEGAS